LNFTASVYYLSQYQIYFNHAIPNCKICTAATCFLTTTTVSEILKKDIHDIFMWSGGGQWKLFKLPMHRIRSSHFYPTSGGLGDGELWIHRLTQRDQRRWWQEHISKIILSEPFAIVLKYYLLNFI